MSAYGRLLPVYKADRIIIFKAHQALLAYSGGI